MLVLIVRPGAVPASEGGRECQRDVPGKETQQRERWLQQIRSSSQGSENTQHHHQETNRSRSSGFQVLSGIQKLPDISSHPFPYWRSKKSCPDLLACPSVGPVHPLNSVHQGNQIHYPSSGSHTCCGVTGAQHRKHLGNGEVGYY